VTGFDAREDVCCNVSFKCLSWICHWISRLHQQTLLLRCSSNTSRFDRFLDHLVCGVDAELCAALPLIDLSHPLSPLVR
jgi:hypothetical protein